MNSLRWIIKCIWQWRNQEAIALGVTGAILGLQFTGGLQLLEWAVLDQWFRLRPAESRTVPIVLVTIAESDIVRLKQWPLSDDQLAELLRKLRHNRPAVIGLNLYRDLPVEPGHAELLDVFQTTPNLIAVEKAVGNATGAAVAPPSILRDRNQFAVNDLILDADGRVRRNLLSVNVNDTTILALGTRVALEYLNKQHVPQQNRDSKGTRIHIGKAQFQPLSPFAGGYVRADTGGYQTLSNFLVLPNGIPSVSLTDVLANRVPPGLLHDKIVLIGSKADSLWGDHFYTPYTTASQKTWSGVELQANIAAQIITSALEGRPLLQGVPEPWEWGWIVLSAGLGTILGWSLQSVGRNAIGTLVAVSSIFGVAYGLFLAGWWIVAISPLLALVVASLLSRAHWVWQTLREANQSLELKVEWRTQELLEKNTALKQEICDRQVAEAATEAANRALQQLAHADGLTQIANRRYFNERFQQEWHRLAREQLPLSLILIDVDFFKLYNDTYGHIAGDHCLIQIASALQSVIKRPADLVARYGGEEFVAILPNTSTVGAVTVAEEMRQAVGQLGMPHEKSSASSYVSLSLGIATLVPTSDQLPEVLLKAADTALYQAKSQGRDRCIPPYP